MRRMEKYLKVFAAGILSISMLTGCSIDATKFMDYLAKPQQIVTGATISSDSKWINSDIDGAIDESTPTNLKDDFYTAVNKEWLLQTEVTKDKPYISRFSTTEELITQRKKEIVNAVHTGGTNEIGMDEAKLLHTRELFGQFVELTGNWEERNRLGAEPVRPYVEAIEQIQTMEDMTAYLLNQNKKRLLQENFVGIQVRDALSGEHRNTVVITSDVPLTFGKSEQYRSLSAPGSLGKGYSNENVRRLMSELGYEKSVIDACIMDAYRFEFRLIQYKKDENDINDAQYLKYADNPYTAQELEALAGDYPLMKILKEYGLDKADSYTVYEPVYVKSLGKLYRETYLQEMKAYYMVHTLNDAMYLLDRESLETVLKQKGISLETADTDMLQEYYIANYFSIPREEIYAADYCSQKQKEDITSIVNNCISYYRKMLAATEWLSEEGRQSAIEKLEYMSIHAVYPDKMPDYSMLQLSDNEEGSLLDAVAAIRAFENRQLSEKVNQPIDRQEWNLKLIPTTVVNAGYVREENSINIMAGFLADDFVYSEEAAYEQNLARIGSIIGHEITHGFDDAGAQFDKDGRKSTWWSSEDTQAFMLRTAKLEKFYNVLTPYPGALIYSGETVKGEAIADMGAVKCNLAIAAEQADFDYVDYFTSYGELWATKDTYETERGLTMNEHPLSFLRANVTLQQFEEFYEAFDIKPGDGMYLAPEKRILVW